MYAIDTICNIVCMVAHFTVNDEDHEPLLRFREHFSESLSPLRFGGRVRMRLSIVTRTTAAVRGSARNSGCPWRLEEQRLSMETRGTAAVHGDAS